MVRSYSYVLDVPLLARVGLAFELGFLLSLKAFEMRLLFSFCFAALLMSSSDAALVTVADATIVEGTTSIDLVVTASGGETVDTFLTYVQVGFDWNAAFNGGPATNPALKASIIGLDNTQGLFQGAGFDPFIDTLGFPAGPGATFAGIGFNLLSGSRQLNGSELFRITVDTSNLVAGDSVNLVIHNGAETGTFPTFEFLGANTVIPALQHGTISVVAVPEPSSFALFAVAGLGFAVSRRSVRGALKRYASPVKTNGVS